MRQPEDELAAMREAGLLRELRRVEPARPPLLTVAGREVVNFSSNDYLGLAQDEDVQAARTTAGERKREAQGRHEEEETSRRKNTDKHDRHGGTKHKS